MIPKKNIQNCPVAVTVNIIGSKWKLLILRDLLSGTRRFGELRKSLAGFDAESARFGSGRDCQP